MVSPSLTVYAAMGLVAGPIWFLHGFKSFRRKRLIENTPTAHIRSMAMGLVEINGKVSGRSSLQAPFSGRPCVYWQVDISTSSNNGKYHKVVHRNESGQPFYIKDDSGVALVYPRGAECRINFQVEEQCLGVSLPECYAQYLNEQVHGRQTFWRIGAMRFRERILEDGESVYILGTAMPRSKALNISEGEELAATGTDGGHPVRQQLLDAGVVANVRQGDNEKTFLISQTSERALTLMLGIKSFGGLVGAPILTLMCLAYFLFTISYFMPRR